MKLGNYRRLTFNVEVFRFKSEFNEGLEVLIESFTKVEYPKKW